MVREELEFGGCDEDGGKGVGGDAAGWFFSFLWDGREDVGVSVGGGEYGGARVMGGRLGGRRS